MQAKAKSCYVSGILRKLFVRDIQDDLKHTKTGKPNFCNLRQHEFKKIKMFCHVISLSLKLIKENVFFIYVTLQKLSYYRIIKILECMQT